MTRANLLPRSQTRLTIGPVAISAAAARDLAATAFVCAAVALLGSFVERARIQDLQAAATSAESVVAAHAVQRERTRVLLLEVARYQEVEREAEAVRRTGAAAAATLARIGNVIPEGVWLTEIDPVSGGYRLVGGTANVDRLSATLSELDRTLPDLGASLIEIDNRDAGGLVRFTARIGRPATGNGES